MTEAATPFTTEAVTLDARRSSSRVELDLLIPPTLAFFQGHFLKFPVVPGVVQLHWAIAFGRRYFNFDASPPKVVQVKFKNIIVPNDKVCLVLNHAIERRRLSFEYRDAEGIRSSGTVAFAA